MTYDLDDVIEHYGVKGMKWGVRKDPDRVSARKKAKMEKKTAKKLAKADKKWATGMNQARMNRAMLDADSRTKEQQAEAFKKLTKTDTYKKAEAGDPFANLKLNFEWTAELATILNSDLAKQAELKSPSGKQAVEITLVQVGAKPLMMPKRVNKE